MTQDRELIGRAGRGIYPMFEPGDRVRLVRMDDDPDPVPVGTEGTVTDVDVVDLGDGCYAQVSVDWDNGRTLSVATPPDLLARVLT